MRTFSSINILAILVLNLLFVLNLQAQRFSSPSQFGGTYYGKLDGRNAKLEIKNTHANFALLEFDVILTDLDRRITMTGHTASAKSGHGGDHILEAVTVKSANGKTVKTMAKMYLHTWNIDYMTVVSDKGYGSVFSRGSTRKLPRPNPSSVEKFKDISDFLGTYIGRLDGRNAQLTISKTASGQCRIELKDLDRNVTFKTVKAYLPFNLFRHHELKRMTLRNENGRSTKVLRSLYMHTWNNDYISGVTTWKGKEYGSFFVRQGAAPALNPRVQPESRRRGIGVR